MAFTYRVLLKPSDICFKQKLLPSSFDDGIPLRETLQQLANEEVLIEDLPSIDVVWCHKQWVWYTLNNRRLWVFRELEKLKKCRYIATRRVENIEHVTDFPLYGSAELIGESNIVEWDEDGCRITLFNSGAKKDASSKVKTADDKLKKEAQNGTIRRDWRELTPLSVTVRWKEPTKSGDDEQRVVTPDPGVKSDKQAVPEKGTQCNESPRERKDSGYSGSSSGRTSPKTITISDDETEYETVFSETEFSQTQERKSSSRFSRFRRDRTSFPSKDSSPSSKKASPLRSANSRRFSPPRSSRTRTSPANCRLGRTRCRRRERVCRPPARDALRALMSRRRGRHDELMFLLHHGGKSRLEQLAMKTELMNTCGFCFKSFKAGVSLSQHIEELKHWACTRCGKYFESYTALGQHKLALDHCNVY
ncbi:uncharacterized protein LOC114518798 [Dendronephthya gigantea]|uniref:uncharacterized protein LOC114518798 n=1 Tax=Dendronephthya gigantea TaxID=151771 RepID=UPI00106AEA35|nr:uncharacterized protein LOC114518798 [Dendronephthya gigantea]